MRLALPAVVAYIGLHYTFTGLLVMCEGSAEVTWCEGTASGHQPVIQESGEIGSAGETGDEEPASEQPSAPAGETGQGENGQDEETPPEDDSEPKAGDVLFQST
jgi:NSS family neurotransmitter:Na+ symporter